MFYEQCAQKDNYMYCQIIRGKSWKVNARKQNHKEKSIKLHKGIGFPIKCHSSSLLTRFSSGSKDSDGMLTPIYYNVKEEGS